MSSGGIIVTGASKGIGEAIAHRLCQLGQRVVIDGRSQGLLQAVAASCNSLAGEDACVACVGTSLMGQCTSYPLAQRIPRKN